MEKRAGADRGGELYALVRQGKMEWERTVDAIADPIAVFDVRGRMVRGNIALAAFLGRPVTALAGQSCDGTGLCGTPWPGCPVGEAARLRRATTGLVALGNGRLFSVTTVPIEGTGGRVSVVQVAKDVTEERRKEAELLAMRDELAVTNAQLTATVRQLRAAQAQLVQSEKLSAIGQLVAGVAHELNNPLTSVLGYAQLLQEDLLAGSGGARPPEDVARDLGRIAEESERAARIVRNLLAFARRQTGDRTAHELSGLLEQVLSLRAYEQRVNNIEVSLELAPDLPPVLVDANQLQQALLNLVLNAEQAMSAAGRSGRLRLETALDPAASAVTLRVCDNGPGIAPDDLPRVFDPFFTTKPVGEGTGLGLSICYGIVRSHGGHLQVESQPGIATVFSIELPVRLPGAPAGPRRVLVIHSDQASREFLTAALTGWGCEVEAAATARGAIERLREPADAILVAEDLLGSEPQVWPAAPAGHRRPGLVIVRGAGEEQLPELPSGVEPCGIVSPPYDLAQLRRAVLEATRELDTGGAERRPGSG